MPFPALHQIEHAVDVVEELMIVRFNSHLDAIYREHEDVPGIGKITLPKVQPNHFYKTEAIEPKQLPAVFILGDKTEHDLSAQNFALQEHTLLVAVMMEDKEYDQLTRKKYRYGEAIYRTLHDAGAGNVRLLVRSLDYSANMAGTSTAEGRTFRADVTARVIARHFDVIP